MLGSTTFDEPLLIDEKTDKRNDKTSNKVDKCQRLKHVKDRTIDEQRNKD